MTLETWLLFVGAVLLLMSTPGPSQLLILSNTLSSGFPRSAMTAAGDLSANLLQMIVATLGLTYLIQSNEQVIVMIQWAGVAYLLYMAINALRKGRKMTIQSSGPRRSLTSLYLQGFVVSAVNPRAVVFFAALFPQFIAADAPLLPQFAALSVTYLVMDGLFLMTYAGLATLLARRLATSHGPIMRYGPGVLLLLVALGLALKSL